MYCTVFNILLTVHLEVILDNNQLNTLFLNVFTSCLYMPPDRPAKHPPPECVIPDDVLIQFGPPDDEHLLLETCRSMK